MGDLADACSIDAISDGMQDLELGVRCPNCGSTSATFYPSMSSWVSGSIFCPTCEYQSDEEEYPA